MGYISTPPLYESPMGLLSVSGQYRAEKSGQYRMSVQNQFWFFLLITATMMCNGIVTNSAGKNMASATRCKIIKTMCNPQPIIHLPPSYYVVPTTDKFNTGVVSLIFGVGYLSKPFISIVSSFWKTRPSNHEFHICASLWFLIAVLGSRS